MKEQIKTYVINLVRATERKQYMKNLLSSYDFLDVSYVEAVDGYSLSEEEINLNFDEALANKRYGRKLNRGEIGCTLSHYKCYNQLLSSNRQFALILEDDISIIKDIKQIIPKLYSILKKNKPVVLFLSGDYWFYNLKKKINSTTFG